MNDKDRNTGSLNTGSLNTGDWNTGNLNTGNRNTGNRNTGNLNTGNWNTGSLNTGNFCTNTPSPIAFDKPCLNHTHKDIAEDIYKSMPYISLVSWVRFSSMTDDQKREQENAEHLNGFLLAFDSIQDAGRNAWEQLTQSKRDRHEKLIRALPNFDAAKFLKCTGIDLDSIPTDRPKNIVVDGVEYAPVTKE